MSALRPDEYRTDNFERTSNAKKREKYYNDLKSGMAKPEDYERFVYGGSNNKKFFTDEQDKLDEKATEKIRQWEEETRDEISRRVGKPGNL